MLDIKWQTIKITFLQKRIDATKPTKHKIWTFCNYRILVEQICKINFYICNSFAGRDIGGGGKVSGDK